MDDEDAEGTAGSGRMDNIAAPLDKESKRRQLRHQQNQRLQANKLPLATCNALYAGVTLSLDGRRSALE